MRYETLRYSSTAKRWTIFRELAGTNLTLASPLIFIYPGTETTDDWHEWAGYRGHIWLCRVDLSLSRSARRGEAFVFLSSFCVTGSLLTTGGGVGGGEGLICGTASLANGEQEVELAYLTSLRFLAVVVIIIITFCGPILWFFLI